MVSLARQPPRRVDIPLDRRLEEATSLSEVLSAALPPRRVDLTESELVVGLRNEVTRLTAALKDAEDTIAEQVEREEIAEVFCVQASNEANDLDSMLRKERELSLKRANSILRQHSPNHGLDTDSLVLAAAGIFAGDIDCKLIGLGPTQTSLKRGRDFDREDSSGDSSDAGSEPSGVSIVTPPAASAASRRCSAEAAREEASRAEAAEKTLAGATAAEKAASEAAKTMAAAARVQVAVAEATLALAAAAKARAETAKSGLTSAKSSNSGPPVTTPVPISSSGLEVLLLTATPSPDPPFTSLSGLVRGDNGVTHTGLSGAAFEFSCPSAPTSSTEVVDLSSDDPSTERFLELSSSFSSPIVSVPRRDGRPTRTTSVTSDLRVKHTLEQELATDELVLGLATDRPRRRTTIHCHRAPSHGRRVLVASPCLLPAPRSLVFLRYLAILMAWREYNKTRNAVADRLRWQMPRKVWKWCVETDHEPRRCPAERLLEPTYIQYSFEVIECVPTTDDWVVDVAKLDQQQLWRNCWVDAPFGHHYNTTDAPCNADVPLFVPRGMTAENVVSAIVPHPSLRSEDLVAPWLSGVAQMLCRQVAPYTDVVVSSCSRQTTDNQLGDLFHLCSIFYRLLPRDTSSRGQFTLRSVLI
ncbi:hypothetical protein PHMEG_00021767 [Phytophthora megakarya]|uniref:Uncharacterized protein n=1 Tax=Phytophthora megakarya TaxID=4795 RepID=A0A225VKF8_9STRA|nr:hypothetical protein PHMEG_00021767 [Phytophthora megakarya]